MCVCVCVCVCVSVCVCECVSVRVCVWPHRLSFRSVLFNWAANTIQTDWQTFIWGPEIYSYFRIRTVSNRFLCCVVPVVGGLMFICCCWCCCCCCCCRYTLLGVGTVSGLLAVRWKGPGSIVVRGKILSPKLKIGSCSTRPPVKCVQAKFLLSIPWRRIGEWSSSSSCSSWVLSLKQPRRKPGSLLLCEAENCQIYSSIRSEDQYREIEGIFHYVAY